MGGYRFVNNSSTIIGCIMSPTNPIRYRGTYGIITDLHTMCSNTIRSLGRVMWVMVFAGWGLFSVGEFFNAEEDSIIWSMWYTSIFVSYGAALLITLWNKP